ncbi:MAG: SsrA-binding protein SmpB [Saprospiraceae bacterium]|nr:SsrA-binding protein SmpB [Saprospiraceae bacterium]MBK8451506.1 SsrA-binding protein SmpB [Saprospiraceae bacterium]MBK8483461.1 SsrA-binding protein SmpB [Saprospiraceae bacterium]MBK9220972.1 SsrA-binding protein SmpB [Saprospiraceae bacterium]MBK9722183.1 SsrA-binding protein SmpB [Saprospiraceae bacterium]
MCDTVKGIEIINRKASFSYHFLQSFEAGILLSGSEVKSIKAGNANMSDAYCIIERGEVWIKNFHITEYKQSMEKEYNPKRDRKLLLNKSEIRKIERKIAEKGLTLIPYKMYLSERGLLKLEIIVASGKKSYDKRESIKEKDEKRNLERDFKLR